MLTNSLNFTFLSEENQERTHIELGEMKGIFFIRVLLGYIVSIFRTTVVVPQMTWQPRPSISSFLHFVRLSVSSS